MNTLINNEDFIAFDTETGGLNAAECALLSIAAVPSWDARPFSVHLLPVGRIDARAAEVNGYTPEEWERRGAVPPKVAMLELMRWLQETSTARLVETKNRLWRCDLAAHNAGFDALFLLAMQQRTGVMQDLPGVWHCTKILMQEARWDGLIALEDGDGNHLSDLGRLSGFWDLEPRSKEHDALQDARCCRHGLLWLRGLRGGCNPSFAKATEGEPEGSEAQENAKKEGGTES